jgi:hypothetical protein
MENKVVLKFTDTVGNSVEEYLDVDTDWGDWDDLQNAVETKLKDYGLKDHEILTANGVPLRDKYSGKTTLK